MWGVLYFSVPVANAASPDVTGRVISSYTGAPVVGVWVKWADGSNSGIWYAQTDSTGAYFFPSSTRWWWEHRDDTPARQAFLDQMVDTDLNGSLESHIITMYDPWNNSDYNFSCGSDPHTFSVVTPVTMSGAFTIAGPVSIQNSNNTFHLPDIIFTPDTPPTPTPTPTPTPVPVYTVKGNVYVDANVNGVKDNGEVNYSGTPTVSASRGTVTVSPGGLYTISNVTAGPLTVSVGIPSGFSITTPKNGPPPTYQIIVGPGCSVGGASGAQCY